MAQVDPTVRAAFALLGLPPDADQLAVAAAYRRLATTTHPDVSRELDAAERFTALSAAYRRARDAAPERTAQPASSEPPDRPSTAQPSPRTTPTVAPPIVAGPVRVEPGPDRARGQDLLWVGPVVRLDGGGRGRWT